MITETEFRDSFAEKLKAVRKSKNMTQKQLGLKCGYSTESAERIIRRWEIRETTPSAYNIKLLAIALECSADALI